MVNRVIHGRDPTGKGNPRSIFLNGASLSATMKGGGGIFINFFKQEYFSFFFFISYKNTFFLQSERLCKRIIIIIIIIKYAMLSHPWNNCKLRKRNTDRGIVFFSPEFHRIHSRIFFFSRRRKSSLALVCLGLEARAIRDFWGSGFFNRSKGKGGSRSALITRAVRISANTGD